MGEGREPLEAGDLRIIIADAHCCMAETSATL